MVQKEVAERMQAGPGTKDEKMELAAGDKVVFSKYAGTEIKYQGEEYIPDIMKTLSDYGYSATFFVGGIWAEKHGDLIKDMANNGFEVANHGYLHKDCSSLSAERIREEIIITEKLISSYTGSAVKLFAPPSGDLSDSLFKVAKTEGYKVIMWFCVAVKPVTSVTAGKLYDLTAFREQGKIAVYRPETDIRIHLTHLHINSIRGRMFLRAAEIFLDTFPLAAVFCRSGRHRHSPFLLLSVLHPISQLSNNLSDNSNGYYNYNIIDSEIFVNCKF